MPSRNDGALPWALRPAARPDVGGGHVARALALGAALVEHGAVAAVVEKSGESWIEKFRQAGIGVVSEAELGDRRWAGVVLDDYGLQPGDVAQWRKRTTGSIVQIDDFGTPLPGIDLAINSTAGLTGSKLGGTPALLGASYIMLQPPYCGRPKPTNRANVERIAVGIGWSDPRGVTERVLAALGRVAGREVRVDVMLGSVSPNVARVEAMIEKRSHWRLHRDAAQPWTLLESVDLAISGSGQSLLERLAFGIPTLAAAIADNQELAFSGVIRAGAAYDLGRLDEKFEDRIESAFMTLAGDTALRSKLSAAAQRLVDGQGAARVARHLADLSSAKGRNAVRAVQ